MTSPLATFKKVIVTPAIYPLFLMFHSITSRALDRNHLSYKGPKPCRNAVPLLNRTTPLVTHSTTKLLEKPTRFTKIYDFIDRLPYNIRDHVSEDYTPTMIQL